MIMKSTFFAYLLYLTVFIYLISCGAKKEESVEEPPPDHPAEHDKTMSNAQFLEHKVEIYPDAIIEMYSPLGNEKFDVGKVPFEFNIRNYPFGEGPRNFQLRMTINGNDPISYHMPIFQREFNTGTYRAIAYLIDQEGIALKEFGNYVDRDFIVGESRPFPDSDEPYMVLNLPESGQTYQSDENLIVDFLLIGGGLKEDRLKFIVSFDGQEYETQKLAPLTITNLPQGTRILEVKLVKEDGSDLEGIFTSARREVMIKQ